MKVSEDGDSVAESVFGLFAPDETEFSEENALMTAISNEAGEFAFWAFPTETGLSRNCLFAAIYFIRRAVPGDGERTGAAH